MYNAIYNPKTQSTDAPGTWRTLTDAEWTYIIDTRITTSGTRYAKAIVNGVPGLIVVPDNWDTSTYALNNTNNSGTNYNINTITSAQWTTLENTGCVFLPAAGYRLGTGVRNVGAHGNYWTATHYSSVYAYIMHFVTNRVYPINHTYRYYGQSVRLVKDVR